MSRAHGCGAMRRSDPALRGATTYRIAVGPRTGRKVFTLQTLQACEPDKFADTAGKISGAHDLDI